MFTPKEHGNGIFFGAVKVIPDGGGGPVAVVEDDKISPKDPNAADKNILNGLVPQEISLSHGKTLKIVVDAHGYTSSFGHTSNIMFRVYYQSGILAYNISGILSEGDQWIQPEFTIKHENVEVQK